MVPPVTEGVKVTFVPSVEALGTATKLAVRGGGGLEIVIDC